MARLEGGGGGEVMMVFGPGRILGFGGQADPRPAKINNGRLRACACAKRQGAKSGPPVFIVEGAFG